MKRVELAPVYSSLTYSDVAAKVESIGAGLMSLGLHRDVRVSIYAETSKEWMICAQVRISCNECTPTTTSQHRLQPT